MCEFDLSAYLASLQANKLTSKQWDIVKANAETELAKKELLLKELKKYLYNSLRLKKHQKREKKKNKTHKLREEEIWKVWRNKFQKICRKKEE